MHFHDTQCRGSVEHLYFNIYVMLCTTPISNTHNDRYFYDHIIQILIVLSVEPVARYFPSGENETV